MTLIKNIQAPHILYLTIAMVAVIRVCINHHHVNTFNNYVKHTCFFKGFMLKTYVIIYDFLKIHLIPKGKKIFS